MKAILIDPFACTVTSVTLEPSLGAYYAALGCSMIEAATYINGRHVLYVDEEGLFRRDQRYFLFNGVGQPLAGRGLIVGFSPASGKEKSATLSADEVRSWVTFQSTSDH